MCEEAARNKEALEILHRNYFKNQVEVGTEIIFLNFYLHMFGTLKRSNVSKSIYIVHLKKYFKKPWDFCMRELMTEISDLYEIWK